MKRLLERWLRKVAGDDLARDIAGDIHEIGSGGRKLFVIAAGMTWRRLRESAAFWHTPTLGAGALIGDIRYSIRSLRRSPWYATTVILVIALGMMLATTVFAVVDGVLFKPLPYPRVGELYAIQGGWRARPYIGTQTVSWSDVTAWREVLPEASFAVSSLGERTSIDDGEPARSTAVSADFFAVVGQAPMLGGFRPHDFALPGVDEEHGVKAVVLSYATWRTRFSGDPAILGRVLHGDDGELSEVVGVLPPSFLFPAAFSGRFVPEVLTALPTPANPERDRARGRIVVARIPRGRSLRS